MQITLPTVINTQGASNPCLVTVPSGPRNYCPVCDSAKTIVVIELNDSFGIVNEYTIQASYRIQIPNTHIIKEAYCSNCGLSFHKSSLLVSYV